MITAAVITSTSAAVANGVSKPSVSARPPKSSAPPASGAWSLPGRRPSDQSPRGLLEARPTEEPEQLLGAVTGECEPGNHA